MAAYSGGVYAIQTTSVAIRDASFLPRPVYNGSTWVDLFERECADGYLISIIIAIVGIFIMLTSRPAHWNFLGSAFGC